MAQKPATDHSKLLIAQIIWSVLVVSIVVLMFVAETSQLAPIDDVTYPVDSTENDLSSIIPFVALALFVASFMFSKLKPTTNQQTSTSKPPSTGVVDRYVSRMIVHCAMHEAVAILGFVLAIRTHSPEAMYPYAFAAIMANNFVFPSATRVGVKP